MLATIEAVYKNGVFRPLVPLDLPNNARVALQIKPQVQDPLSWGRSVIHMKMLGTSRKGSTVKQPIRHYKIWMQATVPKEC